MIRLREFRVDNELKFVEMSKILNISIDHLGRKMKGDMRTTVSDLKKIKRYEKSSWLRKLRLKKGLTQISFANHAGVAQSTISNAEAGREISIEVLIQIRKVFNVSIDKLIDNDIL